MQNVFNFSFKIIDEVLMIFDSVSGHHVGTPSEIGIAKSVGLKQCLPVFIVCLLVGNAIAGERPELLDCRSVKKESVVKELSEFDIPKLSGEGQFYLCWSEGGAELGGGDNKFLSLHDIDGVFIGRLDRIKGGFSTNFTSDHRPGDSSDNSKETRDNGNPYGFTHTNFLQVVFGCIGVSVGCAIGALWVYYTQHHQSGPDRGEGEQNQR